MNSYASVLTWHSYIHTHDKQTCLSYQAVEFSNVTGTYPEGGSQGASASPFQGLDDKICDNDSYFVGFERRNK